jgi:exopolysaccharide production protein ExoZ
MEKKLSFIPELEALRGLAAVSVLAFHAFDMRNETAVTGLAPVVLFFVLSGFVLARSLENNPNARDFFVGRVFRLLPAAAACVLLLTMLHWAFDFYVGFLASFDPVNVFLNALMIRSDINGVMWSMTVECFASPLVVLAFFAYRWRGAPPLIIACVMLFGMSFWGGYVHLLGGVTNLAPLYSFVLGVFFHFLCLDGRRPGALPATAAVAVFVICALRKQTAPLILAEALSSGVLILSIAANPGSRVFDLLRLRPIGLLGQISYSFYLLHPIGLSLANRMSGDSSLTLFLFGLSFTLPMAWALWRFVERPFVALRKSRQPVRLHDPSTASSHF